MRNCYRCEHYHVTWDKKFPHGCRAMNFKSKEFPSEMVFNSSGTWCLMFKLKKHPRVGERQRDGNPPDGIKA